MLWRPGLVDVVPQQTAKLAEQVTPLSALGASTHPISTSPHPYHLAHGILLREHDY